MLRKKVSAAQVLETARGELRTPRGLVPSKPIKEGARIPTALAVLSLFALAGCGNGERSTIHADGVHPERLVAVMTAAPPETPDTKPGGTPNDDVPIAIGPTKTGPMIGGSVMTVSTTVATAIPTTRPRLGGVRPPVHPRPPVIPVAGPLPASSSGCPTPTSPTLTTY